MRAGFFALRAVADYFGIPYDPDPHPGDPISISKDEFLEACDQLAAAGIPVRADRDAAWFDFTGWRVNYDVPLLGLAGLRDGAVRAVVVGPVACATGGPRSRTGPAVARSSRRTRAGQLSASAASSSRRMNHSKPKARRNASSSSSGRTSRRDLARVRGHGGTLAVERGGDVDARGDATPRARRGRIASGSGASTPSGTLSRIRSARSR